MIVGLYDITFGFRVKLNRLLFIQLYIGSNSTVNDG